MKIPGFEGTPEEFHDFVNNHGFDPQKFFNHRGMDVPRLWVIFLSTVIFILLVIMLVAFQFSEKWYLIMIVLSFIAIIFNTAIVQLRFRNGAVSTIVSIGSIIVLSVALGITSPKQAIDELKENVQKTLPIPNKQ